MSSLFRRVAGSAIGTAAVVGLVATATMPGAAALDVPTTPPLTAVSKVGAGTSLATTHAGAADTNALVADSRVRVNTTDFTREHSSEIPSGYLFTGAEFIVVEAEPAPMPVSISELVKWRVVYNIAYSRPGAQDVWHSVAYYYQDGKMTDAEYHDEAYGGGYAIAAPKMNLAEAYTWFDEQRVEEGHQPGTDVQNAWFISKIGPERDQTGSWYFRAEDGEVYKVRDYV